MPALANAAMLLSSTEWRDLITAASLYKSREVLTSENGTDDATLKSRQLARQTLTNPGATVAYMVPLVATVVEVATAATTVEDVPETLILSTVAGLWATLADELISLPEVAP